MINAKGPSFELFLWLSPRAANTEQKVCKPRVCLWTHVISGQMAHLFSVVGSLLVEWEAHCWTPTSPCCSVECWKAFEGKDCLKPPGLGLGHSVG